MGWTAACWPLRGGPILGDDPVGACGLGRGGVASILVGEIVGSYPPGIRQEFRAVLRENRPRAFAALREIRAARAEMASAINAMPFDPAAAEAAMKKVRDATGELQAILQDYLLTAVKRVRGKPAG